MVWPQARGELSTAWLSAHCDTALTHDNLHHTVLGLMDVTWRVYLPERNTFARCCSTDLAQAASR